MNQADDVIMGWHGVCLVAVIVDGDVRMELTVLSGLHDPHRHYSQATVARLQGPNLAVLETGLFNNKKLLFMGSGSSGMIYVYVLVAGADCPQPFFHSVYRRGGISATWETLYTNGDIGDLGITDML